MNKESFVGRYNADYWKSRTGVSVTALSKLTDAKYRAASGCFLAEGVKLTEEALLHARPSMIIVSEDALTGSYVQEILSLTETAFADGCRIVLASVDAFLKITTEKAPQGIISVLPLPHDLLADFEPDAQGRYLLLDTIQDPGNLGTILRSASAFGVDGIITCSCADAVAPKTVRASMGAVFRVPFYKTDDLQAAVRMLQKNGHRVLAAALAKDCFYAGQTPLHRNDCIVIGNEGHGIAPEVISACDHVIRIPMTGETESLNASVAASVLLWEYLRTFPASGTEHC